MALGFWRVSIGGTSFADYTDVVDPISADGGPSVEKVQGYGAAGVTFLDLGNLATGWEFNFTRYFATNTLSTAFWLTAVQTFSGVQTVELTHIDYSSTETVYTITGANVVIQPDRPIGVVVTGKLIITGGSGIS